MAIFFILSVSIGLTANAQCNTVISCPNDTTLPLMMPSLITTCQTFEECSITTTTIREHTFNTYGNGNPGCLQDWEVASGTPSIYRNSDAFQGVTAYSGTQYVLLGACASNPVGTLGDGIVYKHAFNAGQTYTVSLKVRTAQTSTTAFGSLDFVLLQESLNYTYNTSVGCSTTPPIPATGLIVHQINHSNSLIWTTVTFTITNVSSSFNRLWIRPRSDQNTTMHWCLDEFCVSDPGPDVCLTDAATASAFNTWLTKFTNSNGVDAIASFTPVNPTTPSACGGTTSVTYTVTSTGCPTPLTCTKSFSVTQTLPVQVSCPQPVKLSACSDATTINSAYNDWRAGFEHSGGCDPVSNIASFPALPEDISCGGKISFKYEVDDRCNNGTECFGEEVPIYTSYPLDGSVIDTTSSQKNGVLTGTLTAAENRFNQAGKALQFNGSTYIDLPESFDYPERTVVAWFNVTSIPTGNGNVIYQSDHNSLVHGSTFIQLLNVNSVPTIRIGSDGGSATFETPGQLNTWYQAAITRDPTQVKVYLNGELRATYLNPTGAHSNTGVTHATIGSDRAHSGRAIGRIDDVRIYKGILTACEISEKYTASVCQSTFEVDAAPRVSLDAVCPADVEVSACASIEEITEKYNDWKNGFSVNGGCNPTNNLEEFPTLPDNIECGGIISFTLKADNTGTCASAHEECSSSFTVDAPSALTVTCPTDPNLAACSSMASITEAYNGWVEGFKVSGGCNPTSNIDDIPALPEDIACGGTLNFTLMADNAVGTCSDHKECNSSFTVGTAATLEVSCPTDPNLAAGTSSADILTAYNVWKAGFEVKGGCSPTSNIDDIPALPLDIASGGTLNFTFEADNTGACAAHEECSSSFTVENSSGLSVSCPGNQEVPACSSLEVITAAYNEWKTGFGVIGGCNPTDNMSDFPVLSQDIICGGNISFTLIAEDATCSSRDECTSVFTVNSSELLYATCPGAVSLDGCTPLATIIEKYNEWKDGFSVAGGCNPTSNIDEFPALPEGIACGATISFTLKADNAEGTCGGHEECTSSFEVKPAPEVILVCGKDASVPACSNEATIEEAYAEFLASASIISSSSSDGCGGNFSNDGAGRMPSKCGGSVDITWTYASNCATSQSCTRTFTILPTTLTCSVVNGSCTTGNGTGTITANFSCAEGATYSWAKDGSPIAGNSATLNATVSGNYSVTATSAGGCSQSCDAVVTIADCGQQWGCGPGYYKNHSQIWAKTTDLISACVAPAIASMGAGYSGNGTTTSLVRTTFGVTSAQMTAVGLNPNMTLLQAVGTGGGGFQKLVRHGVTALLNSCGIAGHYPYTPQQVLLAIHNAIINKTPEPLAQQYAVANEWNPEVCPKENGGYTKEKIDRIESDNSDYPEALEAMKLIVFPNPSSSIVNLNMIFSDSKERVILEIFNVTGQKLAELYNGAAEKDFEYHTEFNASQLSSGTYFYRLNDGEESRMGKFAIVK